MVVFASIAIVGLWLVMIAFSSSLISWLLVFMVLLNQGPLQWLQVPTLITRGVPEALVFALLLKVVIQRISRNRPIRLVGVWPVTGLLICMGVSALVTSSGSVAALLFIRHTLVFYGLFLAALNMDLNPRSYRVITSFLILMALVQLPVGLAKFALVGIQEGGFIGTLPLQAGSLSNIMPLFVIAFLLSGYCWLGKPYLLALVPWFVAFGIAGEKRAIAFFFPLVLLVVYLIWLYDRSGRKALLYRAGSIQLTLLAGVIWMMSFAGLYAAGRTLISLNPEQRVGGSFDLVYAVQEMYDYTTGANRDIELYSNDSNQSVVSGSQFSAGRVSSSIFTVQDLAAQGPMTLALGRGPGLLIESALTQGSISESYMALGIARGTTGFVWMVQQIGLLGVAFFLTLHAVLGYHLWRIYKRALSPAGKAMGLALISALFVFLLDFMAYSSSWISTGTVQPVWYMLTARFIDTNE